MTITTLFATAMALLTACSSNDDSATTPNTPEITVTLSATSGHFGCEGGSMTVTAEASGKMNAYTNDDWLSITPAISSEKKATFTITATANNSYEERKALAIIRVDSHRDTIRITQAAQASDASIKAPIDGYKLVWNDEFKGSSLSDDWTYEIWPAYKVNAELQEYVKEDQVAEVSDGTLKIHLVNDNGTIKSARLYACVNTGWQYGYFEARIKLPEGRGTWPAFWMMPVNYTAWPADGEIDIMEAVGYQPNTVWSTIHCTKYNNGGTPTESQNMTVDDPYNTFHTYAVEWTESYMTFYVDQQKLLTYKNDGTGKSAWPFFTPFYPILNIAWGGGWGGVQGVDPTVLPATMEVDYLRVFQKQ